VRIFRFFLLYGFIGAVACLMAPHVAHSEASIRLDKACIKKGYPKTYSVISGNDFGFFDSNNEPWGDYVDGVVKSINKLFENAGLNTGLVKSNSWKLSDGVFYGDRSDPSLDNWPIPVSTFIYEIIDDEETRKKLFRKIPKIRRGWRGGEDKEFMCFTGYSANKAKSLNIILPLNVDYKNFRRAKQCIRLQILKLACVNAPLSDDFYLEQLDSEIFKKENSKKVSISQKGKEKLIGLFGSNIELMKRAE